LKDRVKQSGSPGKPNRGSKAPKPGFAVESLSQRLESLLEVTGKERNFKGLEAEVHIVSGQDLSRGIEEKGFPEEGRHEGGDQMHVFLTQASHSLGL